MKILPFLIASVLAAASTVVSPTLDEEVAPEPVRVALAVPITVPPQNSGMLPAETLEQYTALDGLLTRRLDDVINRPVALGIDPMIVASIRVLGSAAPASAVTWLSRVEQAENDTFLLGYADSDTVALLRAGAAAPLMPTSFDLDPAHFVRDDGSGKTTLELPSADSLLSWPRSVGSFVWPASGSMNADDMAAANGLGAVTALLSASAVTGETGHVSIEGASAVVSNDAVSRFITSNAVSAPGTDMSESVESLAESLGDAAAASADRPLFATFDRDPYSSSTGIPSTIDAMVSHPRFELVPLRDVLSSEAVPATLGPDGSSPDAVTTLSTLLGAEAELVPFSSVLNDPSLLLGERRRSLLALASYSWQADTAAWEKEIASWMTRSATIPTLVKLSDSSTLNFYQDKGNLPIPVSNELPWPVTVTVNVHSTTGILVITDGEVKVELEPRSQKRASIPVESIANGRVDLEVSLHSTSGVPISGTQILTTNVVAGWETTATLVGAGIVLVIFIAGIVRTIVLRRKRGSSASPVSSEHDPHSASE